MDPTTFRAPQTADLLELQQPRQIVVQPTTDLEHAVRRESDVEFEGAGLPGCLRDRCGHRTLGTQQFGTHQDVQRWLRALGLSCREHDQRLPIRRAAELVRLREPELVDPAAHRRAAVDRNELRMKPAGLGGPHANRNGLAEQFGPQIIGVESRVPDRHGTRDAGQTEVQPLQVELRVLRRDVESQRILAGSRDRQQQVDFGQEFAAAADPLQRRPDRVGDRARAQEADDLLHRRGLRATDRELSLAQVRDAHLGVDDGDAPVVGAVAAGVEPDAIEYESALEAFDRRPAGRIVEPPIDDVDTDPEHALAVVEREFAHRPADLDVRTGGTTTRDGAPQPVPDLGRKPTQRQESNDPGGTGGLGGGGQVQVRGFAVARKIDLESGTRLPDRGARADIVAQHMHALRCHAPDEQPLQPLDGQRRGEQLRQRQRCLVAVDLDAAAGLVCNDGAGHSRHALAIRQPDDTEVFEAQSEFEFRIRVGVQPDVDGDIADVAADAVGQDVLAHVRAGERSQQRKPVVQTQKFAVEFPVSLAVRIARPCSEREVGSRREEALPAQVQV